MMNFTWPQWAPRDNWIWDAVARRYYILEPATNRVRYEDGSYSSPARQDSSYIHHNHTVASGDVFTPRYAPGEAVADQPRRQASATSLVLDHSGSPYSPTFRNEGFARQSDDLASSPASSTVLGTAYTHHHQHPSSAAEIPVEDSTPRCFDQRPRGLAMPSLPQDRAEKPVDHEAGHTPASDSSPADSIDIELDQASQSETPPRSLKEEESVASGDILSDSPVPADASLSPARTEGYKRRDSHHAASQPLDEGYKRAKEPKNFFKVGKVFYTLLTEPFDDKGKPFDPKSDDNKSTSTRTGFWTQISHGERVFAKTHPLVVVREGSPTCTAVPVTTYGQKGTSKWGVKASDHAIIYSGRVPPEPKAAEGPMQPFAIRVDTDRNDQKLDPLSRVDFGRPYPIQHNAKVKSFGMVNRDSMANLVSQWRNVTFPDERHASPVKVAERRGTTASTSSQYRRAYNDLVKMGWIHDDVVKFLEPTLNAAISKTRGRRSRGATASEPADIAAMGDDTANNQGHAIANGGEHAALEV